MSPPTADWEKFEDLCAAIPSVGPGARYISIEAHCHTPASDDFSPGGPEGYRALAARLADARIDAVFVTDHNTWEGLKPLTAALKAIAAKTLVYPGVELSIMAPAVRIGKGLSKDERKIKPYFFHCLAFLPPSDQAEKRIESLVTNDHKNPEILKHKPTERKLQQGLKEVAETLHAWGGMLLVAHFHQGRAPAKSRIHDDIFSDDLAIQHLHESFDAIEIRDPTQAKFFDGEGKGSNGELIPEKACVLGSDVHHPDEVGKETNWLLVEDNAFDDIRTSLRYRERVLFTDPNKGKDALLHLVTEGTFLGRFHLQFNPGLNALIGTKGAGKSAVLECIRFALGVAPSVDVDKYLNHILGPSGRVWLSVRNAQGETFLFVRSRTDGVPRVVSESGVQLERDAVIPANFPVDIRGWGEVTRLAEDKAAQLLLLDAFDTTGIARAETAQIRELRSELPGKFADLHRTLERLKETRTELDQLQLKKERLTRLVVGKIIDEQEAKERRDSELASYRELHRVLKENETLPLQVISPQSGEQIKSLRVDLADGKLTQPLAETTRQAMDVATDLETELVVRATEGIRHLALVLETGISELHTAFQALEETYQKAFTGLDPNEQDVLLARNEIVQEIARLPAVQGRFDQLSAEIESRIREYADILEAIQAALQKRSETRVSVLGTLNQKLAGAGLGTRLKLEQHRQVTGNLPGGTDSATVFGKLATRFRALSAADALREYLFLSVVGGQRDEFGLEIDDNPAIEFELYKGVWRPSEQLSAGQKSTAVLPLIIMLGEGPVILDQPEDNLDNKYIGSTVVRMVLSEKARRQFVVTSHNATLVVMSDSDLVVEMADRDGKAEVVRSGFLNGPHSTIRQSVLEVLDGGEAALKRRFSKYGLKTS